MIVAAIENFIFFSSLLAVCCFVLAWMVRGSVSKGWWEPHPLTLARVYAAAIVLPPLASAWCELVGFAAGYYQRSIGELALAVLPSIRT